MYDQTIANASIIGEKTLDKGLYFRMVDIGISLATAQNKKTLIGKILVEAQAFSHADMGVLYLIPVDIETPVLEYSLLKNSSLNIRMGSCAEVSAGLPPIRLMEVDSNQPNIKSVVACVANNGVSINIKDTYTDAQGFDFSDFLMFDQQNDYASKSFLTVPLLNPDNKVVGVLQLINMDYEGTGEKLPFPTKIVPVIERLAAFAAVAVDNQMMIQGHKNLLDAFVMCIARAVDAKSPHTSAHCERVPVLTEMLTKAACDQTEGPFRNFDLNENGWYELQVAAWMHDCGKLATPEHILDKATKLYSLSDRMDEVIARFEIIRRDMEIQYLKESNRSPNRKLELKGAYQMAIASLDDDCLFLQEINKGGESMTFQDQDRVRKIANYRWENQSVFHWSLVLSTI